MPHYALAWVLWSSSPLANSTKTWLVQRKGPRLSCRTGVQPQILLSCAHTMDAQQGHLTQGVRGEHWGAGIYKCLPKSLLRSSGLGQKKIFPAIFLNFVFILELLYDCCQYLVIPTPFPFSPLCQWLPFVLQKALKDSLGLLAEQGLGSWRAVGQGHWAPLWAPLHHREGMMPSAPGCSLLETRLRLSEKLCAWKASEQWIKRLRKKRQRRSKCIGQTWDTDLETEPRQK